MIKNEITRKRTNRSESQVLLCVEAEKKNVFLYLNTRLEHVWTLWVRKDEPNRNFEKIGNCKTIRDIWRLERNLPKLCLTKIPSRYALFKKGIRPITQAPANQDGGRWFFKMDKPLYKDIHCAWIRAIQVTVMAGYEGYERVCGVIGTTNLNFDLIEIWTAAGWELHTKKGNGVYFYVKLSDKVGKGRLNYAAHKRFMEQLKAAI